MPGPINSYLYKSELPGHSQPFPNAGNEILSDLWEFQINQISIELSGPLSSTHLVQLSCNWLQGSHLQSIRGQDTIVAGESPLQIFQLNSQKSIVKGKGIWIQSNNCSRSIKFNVQELVNGNPKIFNGPGFIYVLVYYRRLR